MASAAFSTQQPIQALVVHPTEPYTVLAGGDTGLFVSRNGGAKWEQLGTPGELPTIWSLAIDPVDPRVLFAGTPFVTSVMVDPDDHHIVWAGVEIDGVFRSLDGGQTWEILYLPERPNATIWGLAMHAAKANRIVAFSLFGEVYISEDAGDSWRKVKREFGEIRTAVWLPN